MPGANQEHGPKYSPAISIRHAWASSQPQNLHFMMIPSGELGT